jgi:hypothetical protein
VDLDRTWIYLFSYIYMFGQVIFVEKSHCQVIPHPYGWYCRKSLINFFGVLGPHDNKRQAISLNYRQTSFCSLDNLKLSQFCPRDNWRQLGTNGTILYLEIILFKEYRGQTGQLCPGFVPLLGTMQDHQIPWRRARNIRRITCPRRYLWPSTESVNRSSDMIVQMITTLGI